MEKSNKKNSTNEGNVGGSTSIRKNSTNEGNVGDSISIRNNSTNGGKAGGSTSIRNKSTNGGKAGGSTSIRNKSTNGGNAGGSNLHFEIYYDNIISISKKNILSIRVFAEIFPEFFSMAKFNISSIQNISLNEMFKNYIKSQKNKKNKEQRVKIFFGWNYLIKYEDFNVNHEFTEEKFLRIKQLKEEIETEIKKEIKIKVINNKKIIVDDSLSTIIITILNKLIELIDVINELLKYLKNYITNTSSSSRNNTLSYLEKMDNVIEIIDINTELINYINFCLREISSIYEEELLKNEKSVHNTQKSRGGGERKKVNSYPRELSVSGGTVQARCVSNYSVNSCINEVEMVNRLKRQVMSRNKITNYQCITNLRNFLKYDYISTYMGDKKKYIDIEKLRNYIYQEINGNTELKNASSQFLEQYDIRINLNKNGFYINFETKGEKNKQPIFHFSFHIESYTNTKHSTIHFKNHNGKKIDCKLAQKNNRINLVNYKGTLNGLDTFNAKQITIIILNLINNEELHKII